MLNFAYLLIAIDDQVYLSDKRKLQCNVFNTFVFIKTNEKKNPNYLSSISLSVSVSVFFSICIILYLFICLSFSLLYTYTHSCMNQAKGTIEVLNVGYLRENIT